MRSILGHSEFFLQLLTPFLSACQHVSVPSLWGSMAFAVRIKRIYKLIPEKSLVGLTVSQCCLRPQLLSYDFPGRRNTRRIASPRRTPPPSTEALRGAAPAAVLPRGPRPHTPLAGGPELVRVVRVGRGWGSQNCLSR